MNNSENNIIRNEEQNLAETGTSGKTEKGLKKRKLYLVSGIILVAIISWQLMGFIMYKNEISKYSGVQAETQDKIDELFKNESYSLSKIVEQMQSIDTKYEGNLSEVQSIDNKYRLIVVRNKSTINSLNQFKQKIDQLIASSKSVISIAEKSEKLDEANNSAPRIMPIVELAKLGTRDKEIEENNNVKAELVNMAVPEEIKQYQSTLIKAIEEKGLALSWSNDVRSLSREYAAKGREGDRASDPYRSIALYMSGMSYIGDIEKASREYQAHWGNYIKLKGRIK